MTVIVDNASVFTGYTSPYIAVTFFVSQFCLDTDISQLCKGPPPGRSITAPLHVMTLISHRLPTLDDSARAQPDADCKQNISHTDTRYIHPQARFDELLLTCAHTIPRDRASSLFHPQTKRGKLLSRSGYVSAMCLIWSDFAIPSSRAKFGTVSGPALADVTHVLSCCVMSCYLASIRLGLYVPQCAQKVHALFNKSLLQTHTQHTAGTTSRPRSYAKARKVSVQVQPLYSVIKLPAV